MKKAMLIIAICILVVFSGCGVLMNGNYASVKPHKEQSFLPEQVLLAPKTYEDIELILINMIRSGQQKKTISMEKMEGNWRKLAADAVKYVKNTYPLGAYAVSDITYKIGTSNGKPALAVGITYRRSIAEIGAVQQVKKQEEIVELLHTALRTFDVSVAISIEDYTEIDFTQIVRDYAMLYPQYVMEVPRISAMSYPQDGPDRIVELTFSYATSRASLRQMQEQVGLIFSASEIYVSGDGTQMEKYAQLYSFLMNRYDYKVQTSITPAYSLLHHGVGDSKAFATVYAAMCRQAGLDCEAISGTRSGRAWHWNVLKVDGEIYHVDLLRCLEQGQFFYKNADGMSDYVWDYSAH